MLRITLLLVFAAVGAFGCGPSLPLVFAQVNDGSIVEAASNSGAAQGGKAKSPTVAANLFPGTTVAYVQVAEPSVVVSTIFDHPIRSQVEALDVYQQVTQSADFRKFEMGRAFLELHFGMSWREAVETLMAEGAAVGIDAETEGAAVVLVGRDSESVRQFRDKLVQLIRSGEDADRLREGEYRGVAAFEIKQARFATVDRYLLLTNQTQLGKEIIDRILDTDAVGLDDQPHFQRALKIREANPSIWAFVNVEAARDRGVASKLLTGHAENPVVEVLVGGLQSNLQKTPFVTGKISVNDEGLDIGLRSIQKTDWIPEERDYYFGPEGQGRAPALPEASNPLFELSAYRDLSQMWLRAGDLFDQKVVEGFAKADANLTTLFSGRDFGEEVLGAIEPEIGLVVTDRQNAAGPQPTVKLPQFGLVMQLREPETMTRELRRTFESLVGFLNIIGAMEGRNQMELGREDLGERAQLVTATFVPEEREREAVNGGIIWNFSPSVGFNEERFVVASTQSLARQLTTGDLSQTAHSDANTFAQLHADVLRRLLQANREQLIAQNMLEEGHSREEAESEIDLFLQLVSYFDGAQLELEAGTEELRLNFNIGLSGAAE